MVYFNFSVAKLACLRLLPFKYVLILEVMCIHGRCNTKNYFSGSKFDKTLKKKIRIKDEVKKISTDTYTRLVVTRVDSPPT